MRNFTSLMVMIFWFFLAARSFFSCSYMYLPKSMMRQTGGCAVGETSTKSSPFSLAILSASSGVMMPSCSLWSSITRTSRTRIRSLVRIKRLSIRSYDGTETAQSIARTGGYSGAQTGARGESGTRQTMPLRSRTHGRSGRRRPLALDRLGNVLLDGFGIGHGRKAVEHVALPVHQKLGEVP